MQSHADNIFVVIYIDHLNSKQKLSFDILIAAIELFLMFDAKG